MFSPGQPYIVLDTWRFEREQVSCGMVNTPWGASQRARAVRKISSLGRVGSWISIYCGSTPCTGLEAASTASTWPTYVRPTLCLLTHMETHRIAPHQRGEALWDEGTHTLEGVGYTRWNNLISVAAIHPLQTRTAGLKIPKYDNHHGFQLASRCFGRSLLMNMLNTQSCD